MTNLLVYNITIFKECTSTTVFLSNEIKLTSLTIGISKYFVTRVVLQGTNLTEIYTRYRRMLPFLRILKMASD